MPPHTGYQVLQMCENSIQRSGVWTSEKLAPLGTMESHLRATIKHSEHRNTMISRSLRGASIGPRSVRRSTSHRTADECDCSRAAFLDIPVSAVYPINAERCVQHLLSERLRLSA